MDDGAVFFVFFKFFFFLNALGIFFFFEKNALGIYRKGLEYI